MVGGRGLTTFGSPTTGGNLAMEPNKSLGQHWLEDQASIDEIIEFSDLKSDETVLEIGPGKGALTEFLVNKVKSVIAVEFDEILALELPKIILSKGLKVYNQDCLKFDYSILPKDFKVVANIPYYLTSNLLRVLSENANSPKNIILLIQKEVAERVAAKSGKQSILGITVQYFYKAELGPIIKADKFYPIPKIDSQLVKLSRHSEPLFKNVDHNKYFKIVKAGFSQKRKKLHSSLSAGLGLSKKETQDILTSAKVDSNLRAQDLSLDQWFEIYKLIN